MVEIFQGFILVWGLNRGGSISRHWKLYISSRLRKGIRLNRSAIRGASLMKPLLTFPYGKNNTFLDHVEISYEQRSESIFDFTSSSPWFIPQEISWPLFSFPSGQALQYQSY